MRTLVLDSGTTSSYHVMRSLARAGHEVHMVGGRGITWFSSRYCSKKIVCPLSLYRDESAFVEFLMDQVSNTRYDLLMFCGDTEAEAIFRHQDKLSRHVECFIPGPRVLDVAFDKNAAYQHAQRVGVPVPQAHYPQSLQDVEDLRDKLDYPVVIKGQKGSASSHVRFVTEPGELLPRFREISDLEKEIEGLPAIQEYVSGEGYLVHLLFNHGEPLAVCSHRKDREFPIGGGVTSAATTVDIPGLTNEALKMVKSLNWHGLIKLDFKYDPRTDQYKFIELDPRVSASIDITRAAGADQCVMLCDILQGKSVEPALSCKEGIRYRWLFPRDLLNALAHPPVLLSILPDMLSPGVYFDLSLSDWRPTLRTAIRFMRSIPRHYSDKTIMEQARHSAEVDRVSSQASKEIS